MNYCELGKTGEQISEVGMGTWKYGAGVEPLLAGIDCGATLIDTAEYYGNEELVGRAIRGMRSDVFLATKVSPQHFKFRDVVQAAERSLQKLKTDFIDLYQLHWPNTTVPIRETMAAMETLADAGKIRFIGVSNFTLPELKQARRYLTRHRIVSNQMRYSLVDRSIEVNLLRYCQKNDITLIAYSPLARDLKHVRRCDPNGVLPTLAVSTGKTEAQLALNWCLRQDNVVVIPKASTPDRIKENCAASGWQLGDKELEDLTSRISYRQIGRLESFARRVGRRVFQRMGRI